MNHLDIHYNIWLSNFLNPFLSQINSNLAFLNKKIDFNHGKIIKSGKITGINSDGNLKILLNNNDHLFEDIHKKNYNKILAWNHWINYGSKMNWRRPVIKLTDNIDYDVICDEFNECES